ncbi:MAG: HupE/UreJ family protein, partial [Mesorhizobium sp.]
MISASTKRTTLTAVMLLAAALPAYAHVGVGTTSSFTAGFMHPLSGLDHMTAMVAVGLWAALKGGKAIWAWPLAFVGVMLAGGALGMLHVPVPFVEPGILASVVALGLLVALAVDLPVSAGVAIIGLFALFHGHAHGTEVPENAGGLEYIAGFAAATAVLHATGIAAALGLGTRLRGFARAAGAACAALGV